MGGRTWWPYWSLMVSDPLQSVLGLSMMKTRILLLQTLQQNILLRGSNRRLAYDLHESLQRIHHEKAMRHLSTPELNSRTSDVLTTNTIERSINKTQSRMTSRGCRKNEDDHECRMYKLKSMVHHWTRLQGLWDTVRWKGGCLWDDQQTSILSWFAMIWIHAEHHFFGRKFMVPSIQIYKVFSPLSHVLFFTTCLCDT